MELGEQLRTEGSLISHPWLYPIFRVNGYRPTKFEADEHCLRLHLEPQPHQVCCSRCSNREVIRRGGQVRLLRNLPVGGIVSLLLIKIPRVECRVFGVARQIRLGLAQERRSYTRAFARYVLELSPFMTIKDVALAEATGVMRLGTIPALRRWWRYQLLSRPFPGGEVFPS